jgi:hypothetical protein
MGDPRTIVILTVCLGLVLFNTAAVGRQFVIHGNLPAWAVASTLMVIALNGISAWLLPTS